jgi:hypothetical protein
MIDRAVRQHEKVNRVPGKNSPAQPAIPANPKLILQKIEDAVRITAFLHP